MMKFYVWWETQPFWVRTLLTFLAAFVAINLIGFYLFMGGHR